ncbi:MAG: adaptor protein MecA [Clostridia bacterium]|nr:adaptor protein MecA [Clostridia bacterium]
MEIIRVENGSYKISLSADEARKYDISNGDEGGKLNLSVRELLEKLKKSGEVELSGMGRISAEVYISKDGGCEVFISRAREIVPIARSRPLSKIIYKFEALRELLCACAGLKKADYDGAGSVYRNQASGSYYLFLSGIYQNDIKYAFLCECGTKIKASLYPYITEYCKCICENNAIEIFSKLL